jgi:hypothetical protein
MANNRGYPHFRRFLSRRQYILTTALFTIFAFVFSIFLLLYGFAPKEDDILKDDTRLEEPQQSQSVQQQVLLRFSFLNFEKRVLLLGLHLLMGRDEFDFFFL